MIVNIVLVDDHKIFRDGLRNNLSCLYPNYSVCGEAIDEKELMTLLSSSKVPDLILLDYMLPEITGVDIVASLKNDQRYQHIKIIILSAMKSLQQNQPDYEYVISAINAGADGYLLKDSGIEQIAKAIDEVMRGMGFFLGETFDLKEASKIIINNQKKLISLLKKERNFGLTQREVEVIGFLAQGLCAKEIASKMNITEDVVTSFKDNIKRKLKENYNINIKNMVEMVVWAIKNKVIEI